MTTTTETIFVCKNNCSKKVTRSKALTYKSLDLSNLTTGQALDLNFSDGVIKGVPKESVTSDNPTYTILTDEFGVYAESKGVKAKIKVIFNDDGLMLVEVIDGGIFIKPEDNILFASRNMETAPAVDTDNILWVNADKLLSYRRYWNNKRGSYPQDFAFVFEISGEYVGSPCTSRLETFTLRLLADEVEDISDGAIAVIEMQEKVHEEAQSAKKGFESLLQAHNNSEGYDFDDDDDDEEDEDEDDDFEDYFD